MYNLYYYVLHRKAENLIGELSVIYQLLYLYHLKLINAKAWSEEYMENSYLELEYARRENITETIIIVTPVVDDTVLYHWH